MVLSNIVMLMFWRPVFLVGLFKLETVFKLHSGYSTAPDRFSDSKSILLMIA
ncbi:hypothetical protein HMPREF0290_0856 [Corynebacterium efficiens YS-314]|nr:hypothetical protein HMPREF0290_0856 [Corynebacterium efficiens YS-314]